MTEKWSRAVLRGLGSRKAPRLPDGIRQEPVEKSKSEQEHSLGIKTITTSLMGWLAPQEHSLGVKTIITPSQEASKRHLAAIDQRLQQLQTAPQARVIAELNPLIVGWAAYYNGVVPAATMSRYDDLVEQRLINWASKRHPGKARDWLLHYNRTCVEGAYRKSLLKKKGSVHHSEVISDCSEAATCSKRAIVRRSVVPRERL